MSIIDKRISRVLETTNDIKNFQEDRLLEAKYDELIELIGRDNIKSFITFHPDTYTSDGRIFDDYLDSRKKWRGVTESHPAPTPGGPLGYHISGSFHSGLFLDAIQTKNVGDTDDTHFIKKAVRINQSDLVSFTLGAVAGYIRTVGNIDSSKVKFQLYTDDGGNPGSPISWGARTGVSLDETSDFDNPIIIGSRVPSSYAWSTCALFRPVRFPVFPNTPRWLVMEYPDDTGVDANNFVQWRYGSDPGGERAVYDGNEWVVHSDESYDYKIFDDTMYYDDTGFTFMALIKVDDEDVDGDGIFTFNTPSHADGSIGYGLSILGSSLRQQLPTAHEGFLTGHGNIRLKEWSVLIASYNPYFNKDNPRRAAFEYYINGVKTTALRLNVYSPPGVLMRRFSQLAVFTRMGYPSTRSGPFSAKYGPFMLMSKPTNDDQAKKITDILLGD